MTTSADVIRKLHGCESTFVEVVPVVERFQGKIVWEGEVEVHDLVGHPHASQAYVWSFEDDEGEREHVAILGVGPIDSPLKAVQAYLVSLQRSPRS